MVALRDREEALPGTDRVAGTRGGRDGLRLLHRSRDRGGPSRDPEPLSGSQDARQQQPVGARERGRHETVAICDREEPLTRLHGVEQREAPHRPGPRRDATGHPEPLPGRDDARQAEAVGTREPCRAHAVSACDHLEALARSHRVDHRTNDGGLALSALSARERPERAPSGDPVRVEPAGSLESLQRGGGRGIEPTVELRGGQSERPEAELERRDVPADPAPAELTLTEQRLSERAELAAGDVADLPGGPDPVSTLEADDRTAGHRPGDAVDLALVETVRAQRDLERGNLGALRGDRRPGDREGGGNRGDDHDDSTHGTAVLRPRASGSCRLEARLHFTAAAFPGSSIGRASGC